MRQAKVSSHLTKGLGKDQLEVFKAVVDEGSSVFFTGNAGTGKSFLLRAMLRGLEARYAHDSWATVDVTASTGIAAANIGGGTIHAFSGVGFGVEPREVLAMRMKPPAKKRWKNCRALVIDEISMLDGQLLDKLDFIAKKIRGCDKPFGGIQLILCGDFYQLPPVKLGESGCCFCFEAQCWDKVVQQYYEVRPLGSALCPGVLARLHVVHMREEPIQMPLQRGPANLKTKGAVAESIQLRHSRTVCVFATC